LRFGVSVTDGGGNDDLGAAEWHAVLKGAVALVPAVNENRCDEGRQLWSKAEREDALRFRSYGELRFVAEQWANLLATVPSGYRLLSAQLPLTSPDFDVEYVHFLSHSGVRFSIDLSLDDLGSGGAEDHQRPCYMLCLTWHPGSEEISAQHRSHGSEFHGYYSVVSWNVFFLLYDAPTKRTPCDMWTSTGSRVQLSGVVATGAMTDGYGPAMRHPEHGLIGGDGSGIEVDTELAMWLQSRHQHAKKAGHAPGHELWPQVRCVVALKELDSGYAGNPSCPRCRGINIDFEQPRGPS
jgi:hypothetical protein